MLQKMRYDLLVGAAPTICSAQVTRRRRLDCCVFERVSFADETLLVLGHSMRYLETMERMTMSYVPTFF